MSVEFIRVYDNGFYIVAEFKEAGYLPNEPFALNAACLELRIANSKKYDLDTSVEEMALSLVRGAEKEKATAA